MSRKAATLPALRRKLDRVFSEFIRRRDGEYGKCITCGAVKHWKAANAGHFIPRQYLATRYDERNVHLQCVHCNLWRRGNLIEYYAALVKKYGQAVVDELRAKKRTTVRFRRHDYELMIKQFQGRA